MRGALPDLPLWKLDLGKLPGPLGKLGRKELHLWVGGWAKDRLERRARPRFSGTKHLLFCLCDHYEPLHGGADMDRGIERVRAWRDTYPTLVDRFRDSNGRPPRHSYFYPGDQYDPRLVEPIAEMCGMGLGEMEVHLHHDADTRETLAEKLVATLRDLDRHGTMAKKDGQFAWSFIHGNWCLANARRNGTACGVDDELTLLYELGCYADLTFPAAPDEAQPHIVNSIYYPVDPTKKRAYEHAQRVRVGTPREDKVLMIEGPIALALRPGKLSVRIESAAIDWSDPYTKERLGTWVDQDIHVDGRPEWVFVKVHTHGAPEANAKVLLGDDARAFHAAMGARYNDGRDWKLHYVSAREMFNVARAAMDGKGGDPSAYFDYEIPRAERSARGA